MTMASVTDRILSNLNGHDLSEPKKLNQDIYEKLSRNRFDIFKKPESAQFILSAVIDEIEYKVGSYGSLGVISGIAKSRKTTFLSAIVASALSGRDILNMRLRPGGDVVYFDTEQPDYFFYNTQRRAHLLAGVTENVDWYSAFSLREFLPNERLVAIDYVLKKKSPAVCIIDGVLDLVHDMNDLRESQAVAQQLMVWTKEVNCLMLIVLHRNESMPGRGKMAGHLGSVVTRKADFEIMLQNDEASGYTHVKHCPSRVRRFPTFAFTQNAEGYPIKSIGEVLEIPSFESTPFPF